MITTHEQIDGEDTVVAYTDQNPTMSKLTQKLTDTLQEYDKAQAAFNAAKLEYTSAAKKLELLETETLPNILDEAELSQVTLKDGTTITYREKVFTSLLKNNATPAKPMANASEAAKWLASVDVAPEDLLTPVLIVTPCDNWSETWSYDELLDLLSTLGDKIHYDLSYKINHNYNPAQISALGRELLKDGIEIPSNLFSQHIEPGVKITHKKT